jgi:hypothetical protein
LYNRPEVAAVPSGLSPTPLIIIIIIIIIEKRYLRSVRGCTGLDRIGNEDTRKEVDDEYRSG